MKRLRFFRLFWAASAVFFVAGGCAEPCPPCTCEKTEEPADIPQPESTDTADGEVTPAPQGGEPTPVTSFDLHGRAGFFRVNVFERPDMDTPLVGYLRKGTRTMVGDPKYASSSCPGGWYELESGGFVCHGRGMLVGTKPRYIPKVPPEIRLDELDPYRHGYIRRDFTPLYRRLPGSEEELWAPPVAEDDTAGAADTDSGGAASSATAGSGAWSDDASSSGAIPRADTDSGAAPSATPAPTDPEPEILPHDPTGEEGVDYHAYTEKTYKNVARLLMRGFWVSVGERVYNEGTKSYFYETVKGSFVPEDAVHLVRPSDFAGYRVDGENRLPAVIITDRRAAFYTENKGRFRGAGRAPRLESYQVVEEKKVGADTYYKIEGDRWLRSKHVMHFPLRQPPSGVSDAEKWIRVDLSRQTLEAYEGPTPVYVTLVSTGILNPEDPEHISEVNETPKGRYRIEFKHLTDDMAGAQGEDAYSVDDVPFVQYIHRNIALHGAFWHSSFGRPKSHGCVNLSTSDAHFLFSWTEPKLPDTWHGAAATEKTPGTLVIVEGETPKK